VQNVPEGTLRRDGFALRNQLEDQCLSRSNDFNPSNIDSRIQVDMSIQLLGFKESRDAA
jgi:hypothetical protein